MGQLLDAAFWQPVGMAVSCGAILGLERQLRGKSAGMRTSILIWLLAAVGVAIGLDHFREAFAITLTAAGVLVGVERLERAFPQLRRGVHSHALDGRIPSDGQ